MGKPNWGKLFEQGRCKAIGVAWTDAELVARHELGIPAEYVRAGVLNLEDFEKAKKKVAKEIETKGKKPLEYMDTRELRAEASDQKIEFTGDTPPSELKNLLNSAAKTVKKTIFRGKKNNSTEGTPLPSVDEDKKESGSSSK